MSKKLYENIKELEIAIKTYLEEEDEPTPAHFRAIGLGITKYNISTWKKTNKPYYNLIKEAEEIIEGKLERLFTYGGKKYFNISYTLRAYNNKRYNPNYIKPVSATDNTEPVQIILGKVTEKGTQSGREIKLIESNTK